VFVHVFRARARERARVRGRARFVLGLDIHVFDLTRGSNRDPVGGCGDSVEHGRDRARERVEPEHVDEPAHVREHETRARTRRFSRARCDQ
jgi:hypothetical protein